MSNSKRIVQITIPNLRWKDLCKWYNFFLLLTVIMSCWSVYWWKTIRPYVSLQEATLQVYTREILAEEEGKLADSSLEEGSFFSKGQMLCSFNDSLLSCELHQVEEKVQNLRKELSQEKSKLDQNMEQYLYLQNELEAEIGPTELTDQILLEIQQQQEKILRLEREISAFESEETNTSAQIEKKVASAPFEGMVLRRFKEAGEKARVGDPLLLICDKQKRWVEASAPEEMLAKIRLGLPARIEFTSFPGKIWLAQVSWISPIATNGKIKIRMSAENLPLHPGLNAKVAVKIR